MVQTAEARKCNDLAQISRLSGAVVGGVLAQGEVHSVLVVEVEEFGEQALWRAVGSRR